jgi:hypothetical protein
MTGTGGSTHPRSREANCLRALLVSLTANEGSGAPTGARVRRHPLLWADPSRGPRASPRRVAFTVSARRGTLASRRSTAAVFWPQARLGKAFGRCLARRCPSRLTMLHSQVPLVVAGGRCRSGASRALACMHQLAGRRIPSHLGDASRKHPRRTERHEDRERQSTVKCFKALSSEVV